MKERTMSLEQHAAVAMQLVSFSDHNIQANDLRNSFVSSKSSRFKHPAIYHAPEKEDSLPNHPIVCMLYYRVGRTLRRRRGSIVRRAQSVALRGVPAVTLRLYCLRYVRIARHMRKRH